MGRAQADGDAARVHPGPVQVAGQLGRALAPARRRHDLDPHARLEPSTWTVRIGSRWGVGVGMRKSLEKVYRRIDATLRSQRHRAISPAVDPFEEPDRMPAPRRQRLDRLMDRLVERGVDAAVVDRLAEHLTRGSAQESRPDPAARPGRAVRARPRPGRRRLPARRARGPARAALGPALPGLPHLLPDHGHAPRDRRACSLRGLPSRFRARLRQLDRADFSGASGDPRGRPGHLLRRRAGALAARRGPDARRAGERIELELELPAGSYRLRGPQLPWSVRLPGSEVGTVKPLGYRPGHGPVARATSRRCAPAARCSSCTTPPIASS